MKKDWRIEKKQTAVNDYVRVAKKFISCAQYIAHVRCLGAKGGAHWIEAHKFACQALSLLEDTPITDIHYTLRLSIRKMLLNAEKHISRARKYEPFTTCHDLLDITIEHLWHAFFTVDKADTNARRTHAVEIEACRPS